MITANQQHCKKIEPSSITKQETKQKIKDLYGESFIFVGEYQGENYDFILKHKDCGHTFFIKADTFLKQPACPSCHKKYYIQRYNKEKSDTEFRAEVSNIFGNEITLLTPYINSRTKIKIRCNKCNEIREILPYPLTHGFHCTCNPKPRKSKGRLKRTTDSFKQEVNNLVGDEYSVLGEYQGANIKTKMKHNTCGHTFEMEPVRFLKQGIRCLHCNRNYPKTTEIYKEEVKELCGEDFSVTNSYVNAKTPIKIKCNQCGFEKEYIPRNFLLLDKCPNCGLKKKTIKKIKEELN